jgi:hypothetical protein
MVTSRTGGGGLAQSGTFHHSNRLEQVREQLHKAIRNYVGPTLRRVESCLQDLVLSRSQIPT